MIMLYYPMLCYIIESYCVLLYYMMLCCTMLYTLVQALSCGQEIGAAGSGPALGESCEEDQVRCMCYRLTQWSSQELTWVEGSEAVGFRV